MSHSIGLVRTLEDGTAEYRLTGGGIEAIIWSLGGVIQTLTVPDIEGKLADVVLGYDTPQEYIDGKCWLGGVIGRHGGRIAKGKFTLDGVEYQLPLTAGPNYCHGELFHKKYWQHKIVDDKLELSISSPDGEEGFPGTVEVKVIYALSDKGELSIDYEATTDKPTVLSLGNHAYWNLEGHDKGNIFSHKVRIDSSEYVPRDENLIPTGQVVPLEGTLFDLRKEQTSTEPFLDARTLDTTPISKGFVQYYVTPGATNTKRSFGKFTAGGRVLEFSTTQPGVTFYTAYFLDCPNGKSGTHYKRYSAFIPFDQSYPDSPNKPDFPSVVLRPGERYYQSTSYKFSSV